MYIFVAFAWAAQETKAAAAGGGASEAKFAHVPELCPRQGTGLKKKQGFESACIQKPIIERGGEEI